MINYRKEAAKIRKNGGTIVGFNFQKRFFTIHSSNGYTIRKRGHEFDTVMQWAKGEAEKHGASFFDVLIVKFGDF